MSHGYDPAKQAGPTEFRPDPERNPIDGPGGHDELIDNNEKGILEAEVLKVVGTTRTATLQKESGHKWTI